MRRSGVAVAAVLSLVASLVASLVVGMPWVPSEAAAARSAGSSDRPVPVRAGVGRAAQPSQTDGPGVTGLPVASLPSAASAVVATSGVATGVGGLPVAVTAVAGADEDFLSDARVRAGVAGLSRVRVSTAGPEAALAAGVRGVVLSVSGVEGAAAGGRVGVRVGYATWASLYGANFGDRLRLVMLPGCALSTPQEKRCQGQTPLASTNASGEVSAEVMLPGGGEPVVLAVTSSSSSSGATFSQTSLSPVYSWSSGGQGGSFGWRYPLKPPASLGGPSPDLALVYDSGSVDGQTLAQNGQTSWVGEGWDLQTGYVERSYRSCSQDGMATPDLCWFSAYNATLVFGGRSLKLIRDDATGVWHTDDDDALRVEQRFDTSLGNGDNDGEHWVLTDLDGTQYWFGRHKRHGSDPQPTSSVQTVPVYGNNPGEPCYATSYCWQGYRWNLDYVVDALGNSMTYFYTRFTGYVGLGNNQIAAPYDLSSTLDHIDYGTRAGSEGVAPAPMQVWFDKANRCLVADCNPNANWPDTPWDLYCSSSTSCPSLVNPVFWSKYRLSRVYTQVRRADGSGYRKVDQWDLTQTFPPTGDNISPAGDDTSPNLWLQSLTHTGYAEDGLATLAEPAITFGGTAMFNRVDWGNVSGTPPYVHYRLTSILNGVGGQTVVSYSGMECLNGAYKANPGVNPLRCFPQYFQPQQAPAGWGWFNKYVVNSVTEKDLTAAATPDETWAYTYSADSSTDTSLWAHDFGESAQLAYRSWPLWRGYTDVTTTHGPAGGVQTVTRTLYHRGMDGDSLAATDNQSMVWEGRRASLTTPTGTPNVTAPIGGVGGKCLDAVDAGTVNGTAVQLYDCGGGGNQVWQYNQDTTSPQMLTFKNPASGRCLDVNGGGSADGTKIQLWDCNGGPAQVWRFAPDGSLVNPATGKCADVSASGTANQTPVLLYACSGATNQVWRFRADGSLVNPQTARCVDVYGGASADGSKISSWACNNSTAQQWTYSVSGSTLKNPQSGKCVDVAGNATTNGAPVQLFTCNDGPAQIWVPQPNGSLKNPNSGRCLDAGTQPYGGRQLFLADCNGLITQRWATQIVDSVALAGAPREEFVMDGSTTIAASTIHSYQVTQTGWRSKPITGGQDLKAFRARETNTKTRTWIAATGVWRWTDAEASFDSLGRTTQVDDRGDMASATDDRCIQRGYATYTSSYLINVLRSERILRTCTSTPADADYLAGTLYHYDGDTLGIAPPIRGLLTLTKVLAQVADGVKTWKQKSRTGYDSYGRVTSLYDAVDRLTTTVYTPAVDMPVTSIAVTGPMRVGWTETTTVDPGRSTPTTVTDINGKVSTAGYDPLGRLTRMWRNNRATASTPDRQYTYTLASPSWTRTQTLGPNGQQIDSYQIFDGNLAPRQTQNLTQDGKRVITDIRYDPRGLTAKESVFYNNASGPSSTLVWPANGDADIEQQHRYLYDTRQRRINAQFYTNDVLQFQTTTAYDGDRMGITPPAGGTPTQQLYDARDQIVATRQYSGTPFTGAFIATSYTYDRLGQLTTVTDPAGNNWTYEYDLRGRKTRTIDPDSGTQSSTFYNDGSLKSSTDGRLQTLFYEYDQLGRKVKEHDTTETGPVLAEWIYDETDKAQLGTTIRHVGADAYTTRITARDEDYQPEHLQVQIPNPGLNGALAATYSWDFTYRVNGAPQTSVLPGAAGLPAETLTSTYDTNGYAQTLTGTWSGGSQTYLSDISYHYDGLINRRYLGDLGKRVYLETTYGAPGRRLSAIIVNTETPTSPGQYGTAEYSYTYNYDGAGNITGIAGNTNEVADQKECFTYDYLRRLREAWTETNTCTTPQRTGADPYWRQWAFDTIGNRLTHTDKDPVAGDTTWTYTVGTAAAVKPHQLKTVTATGPKADTPTRTFGYDPAGNTTTAITATGAAETLTWDQKGHLATIAEGGDTTSYVYDADGNRLIARTPTKTTLYLPTGTELDLPSGGTVHATRYYGDFAVRNNTAAGVTWQATNHQGTSLIQIDSLTLASTRQRTMPYGEARGSQPTTWIGTKGYVGGTNDQSGLMHLGAREYDPTLGRFLSVDPIMDLSNPQQSNAYSYSNNNPVTFSDPTGLKPKFDDLDDQRAWSATQKPKLKLRMKEKSCSGALSCAWDGIKNGSIEAVLGVTVCYGPQCEPGTRATDIFTWQALCACMTVTRGQENLEEIFFNIGYMFGAMAASPAIARGVPGRPTTPKPGTARPTTGEPAPTGKGPLRGCTHSFDPTTHVLMADGTTKPIKDVKVGDQVQATDPETDQTTTKTVTDLHHNLDTDLTDLTVRDENTGQTTTLHTTQHHPFWNGTTKQWTDAKDLTPGTQLHVNGTTSVTVVAVHTWTGLQQMLDLTVADIHTYYVIAGHTPVLVHNCGKNIYESGGKHLPGETQTSRGVNSAEPKNGQAALDNSVQVKATSPRRVGVGGGEIVVLDRTGQRVCGCIMEGGVNNIFHGHVRAWDDLTSQMQNALRRAGMVDRRGNIL